jgi:RHS repeat-associated protein
MVDYSTASAQTYYAHNDHLGTPKLLTNSQAKPVWQASYTPFGLAEINADVDQDGQAVTLNIRFAGQYYDIESGLHYNWFRYYDPAIGRYVTSDPIGLAGGINTYGYVGGNPVGFVDPDGLTKLRFNRGSGVLIVDPEIEGRAPYSVPATSGDPSCSCNETVKNRGPIPVANYYLNVSDLTNPSPIKDIARNWRGGDWGDWRVPLKPTQPERLYGRSGFFLHGGAFPGSAGCVDIGGGLFGDPTTDKVLKDILNDPDGKIQFKVRSN